MPQLRVLMLVAVAFVFGLVLGATVANHNVTHAARTNTTIAARYTPKDHSPPTPAVDASDEQFLVGRRLIVPVSGVSLSSIKDSFNEMRGGRRHEATDIMAPTGTPVVAADDGVIKKLFTSRLGGLTIYQFEPTAQYCYYYAHLERYAGGISEGSAVKRGDVIAYVDSTGDASPDAPHLHFAIFKLGPDKKWWQGAPIDPYPILMGASGK